MAEGRPTLCFVTPAFGRLEISAVCFAHRAWAIERLRELGIDACSVVIANDGNLDLAAALGFKTLEQRNDLGLGRKFNDGYAWAASEGIQYVIPMGSDSWVDPGFVADALERSAGGKRLVAYSQPYAVVHKDGDRRIDMQVIYEGGTSMLFRTELLRLVKYRPIRENAPKGCDSHTIGSLKRARAVFRALPAHQLSTVGFQTENQISRYDLLFEKWGIAETDRPFEGMDELYPATLIAQIAAVYEERRARAEAEAAKA